MATPLRKDQDEKLTTTDLAQDKGAASTEKPGPKPVISEGKASERAAPTSQDSTPLFPNNGLEELRKKWSEIQTAFVDEPRKVVEQADDLVASAMKRLGRGVFSDERSKLEKQWDHGDSVSTEDLRLALQRYRTNNMTNAYLRE